MTQGSPSYLSCLTDGERSANAFTFIRLAAALLVVYSHCFSLGGSYGADPWSVWSAASDRPEVSGTLAVLSLFAISGFLVSHSLAGSSWSGYFWKRDLRIFPGYWVGLLVTAFLFAPAVYLAENGAIHGYFSAGGESPWAYLMSNAWLHYERYGIRGLLASNPHRFNWNGTYWTLGSEYLCYCLVAFLSLISRRRPWLTVAAFLVMWVSAGADPAQGRLAGIFAMRSARDLFFVFFFAGAAAYHLRRVVPLSWRWALAAFVILLVCPKLRAFDLCAPPALTYLTLWLAATLPVHIERWGDYSYGIYIYGFPVQQLMVFFGLNELPLPVFFSLSVLVTLPLAFLSWRYVEKPALSLRRLHRHVLRTPAVSGNKEAIAGQ